MRLLIQRFLNRLGGTEEAPLAFEVAEVEAVTPASSLLWHISWLPGVRVLAKKAWALTDDFEAYFQYKGCRYRMSTPMVNVWVEALSPQASAVEFSEIENHVRRFSSPSLLGSVIAVVWAFFFPANVR